MNRLRLILLFLTLPLWAASQNSIPTKFVGTWRAKCERAGSFQINANGNVSIEVNSNQIYINAVARVKSGDPTTIEIFYKNTSDLGAGGAKLKWNSFSKTRPIATIQALPAQKKRLFLFWNGFFNTKTKKYEWAKQPDWFEVEGFNSTLYKCKY
jgi:hypothetical protein